MYRWRSQPTAVRTGGYYCVPSSCACALLMRIIDQSRFVCVTGDVPPGDDRRGEERRASALPSRAENLLLRTKWAALVSLPQQHHAPSLSATCAVSHGSVYVKDFLSNPESGRRSDQVQVRYVFLIVFVNNFNGIITVCDEESRCQECKRLGPSENNEEGMCDECQCLFNSGNCYSGNCTNGNCVSAQLNLGLSCSSPDGPIEFVLNLLNETTTTNEITNRTLCLSRRICHCLSRSAEHNRLIDTEEQCRQLCVMPTHPVNDSQSKMGSLSGDMGVCNSVHGHYCRRHTMSGRSVDCARECRLQDNCVSILYPYCVIVAVGKTLTLKDEHTHVASSYV